MARFGMTRFGMTNAVDRLSGKLTRCISNEKEAERTRDPFFETGSEVTAAVGRNSIDRISRRQVVQGAVATTAAITGAPSAHSQNGRQTLRFMAQADLKVLDPIWTTAYITRNHGYLAYDTLFGTDENFQVKPQMVDRVTVSPNGMKYTFTLRDGLRWHDGQPVLSGTVWSR
jgi:MarR-like DNA-binding transcriptional regulator SgrR of sgrS sRNA